MTTEVKIINKAVADQGGKTLAVTIDDVTHAIGPGSSGTYHVHGSNEISIVEVETAVGEPEADQRADPDPDKSAEGNEAAGDSPPDPSAEKNAGADSQNQDASGDSGASSAEAGDAGGESGGEDDGAKGGEDTEQA